MNKRKLGSSGLSVSEVGYGAWGLGGVAGEADGGDGRAPRGWTGTSENESLRALDLALDKGMNFIDTALGYGGGRSEQIVGKVARDRSEEVLVASKVPPKNGVWPAPMGIHPDEAFPESWIRECVERSLRNTGLDHLDLIQLHVWSDDWVGRGTWLEALTDLKTAGTVRSIGISLNNHESDNGVEAVRTGAIDSVQVIYNLFDQSAEDRLFPACRKHEVGVIARVPFDEGALTGTIRPDSEFPEGDFRREYFQGDRRQQVFDRVNAICADIGIEPNELAAIALRFILSNDTVSTVIPGMRSVRNVRRNVETADLPPLSAAELETLKSHRWTRNFY